MTVWRIIIPAVLASVTLTVCIAYLVKPPFALREAIRGEGAALRTLGHDAMGQRSTHLTEEEKAAEAYLDAAQAILRRTPDARASADKPSSGAAIPLPRRRPIPPQ
jgi:hypothetical protein